MGKREYTRDSLERALIHHGRDYSPPGPGQSRWRLQTDVGPRDATSREVWFYVAGLADKERGPSQLREVATDILVAHDDDLRSPPGTAADCAHTVTVMARMKRLREALAGR